MTRLAVALIGVVAMFAAIVVGALVFARFLAVSGQPVRLGDFLIGLNVNR